MTHRLAVVAAILMGISAFPLDGRIDGEVNQGGVDLRASRSETGRPAPSPAPVSTRNDPATNPLNSATFTPAPQPEYLRVIACPGNSTTHPGQDPCLTATTPCRDKPGTGVLTRIYTRPPGNPTTPWQHLTDTCDPQGYRKVGLAACRHRDVTRRVYTAGGHGGLRDRVGV